MRLTDEQWEFLKDVAKLIRKAEELGIKLTAGEMYRTAYQQEHYVKTGRSKTMHSNHLRRLAVDFNFFIDTDGDGIKELTYDRAAIEPLGRYWESLNPKNRWGGHFKHFKDIPHFERNV